MPHLHFNALGKYLTLNGNRSHECTVSPCDSVDICYSENDISKLPAIFQLKVQNSKPVMSEFFTAIDWQRGHFEIIIKPPSLITECKCIHTMSVKTKLKTHTLNVYSEQQCYYCIDTDDAFITKKLECEFTDFVIKASNSMPCYITLTACSCDKKYVAVFQYTDDYRTLFEAVCDAYQFIDDGIVIYDKPLDMLNRTVKRKFTFTENQYKLVEISFERNRRIRYIDKLVPYEFLESVYYRDYDYAVGLLCPSLRDYPIDRLLPNFYKLSPPKYFDCNAIALLCRSDKMDYATYYSFETENGQITSIRPLDNL